MFYLYYTAITSRYTAKWPLRHYRLQFSTKRSIFADEMYSKMWLESWVGDHFGLDLT